MGEREGTCEACGKLDGYITGGWCAACYQRWIYNGKPAAGPLRIYFPRGDRMRVCDSCEEKVDRSAYIKSLGWCRKCERKWVRAGKPADGPPALLETEARIPAPCPICNRTRLLSIKRGWCNNCTARWRQDGMPESGPLPLGPPPRWHGKLISNSDFSRYINSKAWKTRRRQRLKLDDYRCQGCGVTAGLHVHHRTYERFRNEIMDDLVTVCGSCHALIHKIYRTSPDSLDVVTEKILQATIPEREVLEAQGEAELAGPKVCTVPKCTKEATRRSCKRDVCAMHETRWRRTGSFEGRRCLACNEEINDKPQGWASFCSDCETIWGRCGNQRHKGERLLPLDRICSNQCKECINRDAREKRASRALRNVIF